MFAVSLNLSVRGFRTTRKGFLNNVFPTDGSYATALLANIYATALDTKSRRSAAEGELAISMATGAATVHSSRYPSFIHFITKELRTNVLQNVAQMETLPVAISPCPAGSSHGISLSRSSPPSPTSGRKERCVHQAPDRK